MIALLNKETAVEGRLVGKSILVCSIVLGELHYGARKSARPEQNLAKIESFIADYPILDCAKQTAEQYGVIKHMLETKGKPIPENDLWIAALAIQHSLTLVTRDEHFKRVDGLLVERW